MPYIGRNHIAGDHTSNFKVLDDISSYTATFNGSSTNVVSTANETLRILEHRFIQGQRVTYTNGGGGNIGGLTTGTAYFVTFDTHNTIKLATSLSNANNNININLSSVGSGTAHTLNAAFDGTNTKFKLTHNSGDDAIINNATQLQVAINNVIQRPNQTALSFTEGFAIEDNHKIVFKTAPTSNDVFWGSIIANTIESFDSSDFKVDNFTGDGSTTTFTLSKDVPNVQSLMVTLDGVTQHASDNTTTRSYSLLSGNTVEFTAPPGVGIEIQVKHLGFAGAATGEVSGFYGRTGNVTLSANDHITTGDITARNFKATGITTFSGDGTFGTINATTGTFSGNVSIGGTLTYEDVTNIDSVGLGTFRNGIDCNGDLDVDGHTNLDNVSIAGVTTITQDLDVDGHTNLDNVSVAGVTTFSDDVYFDGATAGRDIIFDRSANTLQIKQNAILQIGDGSTDTEIKNDGTNTFITHNPITAFYVAANTFQVFGSGNRSGNVYDSTLLRCHNGVTELGHEIPSGGAQGFKLATSAKGITVGTGVTIETNGQAEIAGITTFYKDVHIKSATNRLYLGTADRLSLIADPSHSYLRNAGSSSHFQIHSNNFSVRSYDGNGSVTLFYSPVSDGNEGGGPRLYHNHGAGIILERLRTTKSGVNIVGTTTSTQLAITGVSTFTGNIVPSSDSATDIGTNSVRFANIYADTLYGDGSNLTGIAADKIFEGNTEVETVDTGSDGHIKFTTEGTERLRITNAGRFSLGTINASPSAAVHIDYDSNNLLMLDNETASTQKIFFAQNASTHAQIYATSNTGALTIESDPSNNHSSSFIDFRVDGGEKLRIDSSGNLMINSSSAEAKLDVTGGVSISSNGVTVSPSGYDLKIRSNTAKLGIHIDNASGTPILEFGIGGATGGRITTNTNAGPIIIAPNNVERLRIAADGQVLPGADDAQNLGSSTKRWKNIYAADMHFSNEGKTNDVDGTWGDWTLQEGEDSVFMINNRTGKKYAITMREVN